MRRAVAHFHAIGLCRQVTFYRPLRAKNTDRGVWSSHRPVAQEALARGQRRVLILEDDVEFRRPIADLAPRLARVPPNWWGIYLGHYPFQAYFVARGLLRTRSLLTHAYIANAPLLDWLATTEPLTAEVPVWRSVTICSAPNLFFRMTSSFPSHSLTSLGLKKPGQVNLTL